MAPKKIIAFEAKQARKVARQKLGSLAGKRVSLKTKRLYQVRFAQFLIWLHADPRIPDSLGDFDARVAEYIEYLWGEGEPKSWASYTVAAVQYFMTYTKRSLVLSWSLLRVWGKLEMPARAPPCTDQIALGLCGMALLSSRLDLCVVLLVGFHCFLRTGEMCSLRCGDILIDFKRWRGVINLGLTKTGKRKGSAESVTLDDGLICKLAYSLVRGRPLNEPLLKSSPTRFRRDFKLLCEGFGLAEWAFKPYSIRRGGATSHLQHFGSLSLTIDRGRWEDPRSARIYLQAGMAQLADMRLTPGQELALGKSAKHLKNFASKG